MRSWLSFFSSLLACCRLAAEPVNSEQIVARISQAKSDLIEQEAQNGLAEENLFFLSIWNFDNTILHGDTTEGRVDGEGSVVFKGLAQVAIEAGLSKKYPPSAFARFWKDYQKMESKDEVKAYAYPAQIFAGAQESALLELSTAYFASTLQSYFFQTAQELIASLQNRGVAVHIVTASPQLFVQGAAPLLNLPPEAVSGMQVVVKNGVLTDQMVQPLTTRQGKVDKIQEIVQKILASDSKIKRVYVLAGFGNDNPNDIVFLKWIAKQPFETPLSVVGFQPPSLPKNFVSLLLD